MKIFATNLFDSKNVVYQEHRKNLCSTNHLERQPQFDVVTFGATVSKFRKTLYRAISIDELKVLLSGKTVGSHKYVTSSPMGYGARDWASGFASRRNDVFFIKFKDNHFSPIDVMDRRDREDDTRYVITKEVSLDDVHSIYRGHNINGEMIWAYDKSLKDADREQKLVRIQEIFSELESVNADANELVIELGSYVKQFPDAVFTIIKNEKIKLPQLDLSYLINKSESPQYYTYIKDLMEKSLKNSNPFLIDEFAIKYMKDFVKEEDFDLILEIFEKDPQKVSREYSMLISNITNEKNLPRLEELFNKGDCKIKNCLLRVFKNLDSKKITDNKAFEYCEKTLNEIKGFKKEDYKQNENLQDLLFTCVNILDSENNYLSLKPCLIKHFCNLNLGTDPDFNFYLTEVTK